MVVLCVVDYDAVGTAHLSSGSLLQRFHFLRRGCGK